MIVKLDGTDISAYADIFSLVPYDQDLTQVVGTAGMVIVDQDSTIPKTPDYYHSIETFEDDGITRRFGGYVSELEQPDALPVGRAWRLACQDWNARLLQTATGSLNKSGVTDTDRNFVIAILRDALKNQSFGAGTGIDDAIVTANEPDWPQVKATAFVSGKDWSYTPPKNAVDSLAKVVPNVSLRIGHDKIAKYGVLRERAAFDLATEPDDVSFFAYGDYSESEIVADHVNKMRCGGAGASEVTAYDEASHARFHRIFDTPYVNDTAIPSADLKRRAYAELQSRRVRRIARAKVWKAGLVAGQEIDVYNSRLGAYHPEGPQLDFFNAIFGRERGTKLPKGYRGRFLIQKVSQGIESDGKVYWQLELGDPVRDFATDAAVISYAAA
jgi:hypothetical protein